MTNLGDIFYYLRIKIDYSLKDKITFCQNTYLKKVLDYFNMIDCKPTNFFMNLRVTNLLEPFNIIANSKNIK